MPQGDELCELHVVQDDAAEDGEGREVLKWFAVTVCFFATWLQRKNGESNKTHTVQGPLNEIDQLIYGMGYLAMSHGTLSIWKTTG